MDETEVLTVARGVVSGLSEAALLRDELGKPILVNAAYVTMANMRYRTVERDLASGVEHLRLTGDASMAEAREVCRRQKQVFRLAEARAENVQGQEFTVLFTLIPLLDGRGDVVGFIECFRDVSDEARIQQRYKEMLALEQARASDLERQVAERTKELTAALAEVTRLARTDPLTKLLNRRAFAEFADQALGLARRYDRSLAIILCDLDHFKKLNDTYGHQAGDAVLVAASQALGHSVRNTDKVARFGGEEFIILLSETAQEVVATIAERCRQSVRSIDLPSIVPGATRGLSISVGAAIFPAHADSLDTLIARADEALYAAKHGGRDRVVLYSAEAAEAAAAPAAAASTAANRPKVLVLESPLISAAACSSALGAGYEVVVASDPDAALADARREPFEAIVAGERSGHDGGVALLQHSLRVRPEAVRVLVVGEADLFLEARGANLARVDCFLLGSDLGTHLRGAIEDAGARRAVDRQRLLLGSGNLQQSYAVQLDELDRLLTERAVALQFQPIFSAKDQRLVAYEGLCRATHAIFRNPAVLFEAAIQSGNIWRLGRLIREIAGASLPRVPEPALLFVNVHPAELEDPDFVASAAALAANPGRVVFEITERGAISDLRRFAELLHDLKSVGFRFAVDDLGAGYASLNSVALLGPDFVKLDMALVRGIEASSRSARLVRRLVDFANDEGLQVVAEGVETTREAEAVIGLGCHLVQGYLFGCPGPLP